MLHDALNLLDVRRPGSGNDWQVTRVPQSQSADHSYPDHAVRILGINCPESNISDSGSSIVHLSPDRFVKCPIYSTALVRSELRSDFFSFLNLRAMTLPTNAYASARLGIPTDCRTTEAPLIYGQVKSQKPTKYEIEGKQLHKKTGADL